MEAFLELHKERIERQKLQAAEDKAMREKDKAELIAEGYEPESVDLEHAIVRRAIARYNERRQANPLRRQANPLA